MAQPNLSVVMSVLGDAPIMVWSVSAQHKDVLGAHQATPLRQDLVCVHVGQAYFAAFAQASPHAAQALDAAFGGARHTTTARSETHNFFTHYTPHRVAQAPITRVDAVTTIMPHVPPAPSAEAKDDAPIGGRLGSAEPLHLLQHTSMAVSLMRNVGDDLVYAFANPVYEALMQAGPLAGRSVYSVFADTLAREPKLKETLMAVARHGVRGQGERERPVSWAGAQPSRFFDFLYQPLFDAHQKPCGIGTFAYDVTPQVAARGLLQANELRLSTLADSIPQIVWTSDKQGQIRYFNRRWYEYTGLHPDHDGTHAAAWRALCHPDDLDCAWGAWTDALEAGTSFTYESRLYDRCTKTYKWFLHRAEPARDASGQITQWFGSSTNVDCQKRRQDQVDNVIESMNDAFFAVDAHWTITRINAKLEQISKMSREQQIGRNFLHLYFPEPADHHSAYWQAYHKVMRERLPMSFEDYYAPLNIWTDVNVYPSEDGGLAVFFRDVSQERQLHCEVLEEKQKFEAIFSDSPACMALLRGPDLIFEKVNRKYMELMGHRDPLNKALHDALPELIGQPFHRLLRHVLDTGEPYIATEMAAHLVRKIGSPPEVCYFDFTYSRVEDGLGQPYGVYIHATDITEKVMVRDKTARLAERLSAAVQSRDEFLSIASHELKTPVTSLKMQLQMTRRAVRPDENKAPLPTKLAKTLDLCCRQVDRLTALIEDLVDVSRVESGKMTFNFEVVNLSRLVDEVVERFGEQLKSAGCSIDTHYSDDMWVHCDAFRIEQVVTNLLSNAMKYGAGTPVHIEASFGPDQNARIVVRDEGMGIAKDKQHKVFDRFERAISYNNVSGLGLGLYISRQIVEAHRGQIYVDSDLGCGSTFTVELPQGAEAHARPSASAAGSN